ncbi:hypothetical protein O7614_20830 [Micromonospora sp. WMMD961]|uniref:hypothetical protein n=1 Tax=Micromonospora sp. WMMD961 TaxID=3016100 RepID=UPI0024180C55|nr:hypothetical protein [Micromonospora sp. WMMD961]MDG4782109.1 hypothetical protein [Micromonospora sp. WMMD961]
MLKRAVWQGLAAGLVGAVVMTAAEKVEQRVTGRPDSYVPARVLVRLAGLPESSSGQQPRWQNLAMHYGQGALVGVLRGVMAQAGLRGVWASSVFTALRLANDQILENATGVGAPPQTWPRLELAIDMVHKSVYAFATGAVADTLAARDGAGPGQRHAALRPGRQSDVGPLPYEGRRKGLAPRM